jgi:hypothetical protein
MAHVKCAGIDYPLKHVLSRRIVARLRDPLQTLPECSFDQTWGSLSYQKCRSCDRGLGELKHMRKYGVRHYICDECLTYWRDKTPVGC